MHADPALLQARLDAWREQRADRIDPLRFGLMCALAERAARYQGRVRQRLDARLAQLADAFAEVVEQQLPASSIADTTTPSPLALLLEHLNAVPLQHALPLTASKPANGEEGTGTETTDAPLLPVLDEFQQLWGRIRIESLLRQCLDSLPADAGPLHSSVLTYRAMALMQDISPDYLQHFIAYIDVLTWMEQLGGGAATGSDNERVTGKRRAPRRKAR